MQSNYYSRMMKNQKTRNSRPTERTSLVYFFWVIVYNFIQPSQFNFVIVQNYFFPFELRSEWWNAGRNLQWKRECTVQVFLLKSWSKFVTRFKEIYFFSLISLHFWFSFLYIVVTASMQRTLDRLKREEL